jgi:hypothetical protein
MLNRFNPIQYTAWRPEVPFETITRQILTAVEKNESLPLAGKSDEDVPVSDLKPDAPVPVFFFTGEKTVGRVFKLGNDLFNDRGFPR